MIPFLWIK